MTLQLALKEKELVERRRDEAFSALIDLLAERRRILNEVQNTSELMGMYYVASRAED